MSTPHFEHDCDGCVFLGSYEHKGCLCDLYFCGQGGPGGPGDHNTVIARYSDDPPDYASGMTFALLGHQPAKEALDRAVAQGLTTIEHERKRGH